MSQSPGEASPDPAPAASGSPPPPAAAASASVPATPSTSPDAPAKRFALTPDFDFLQEEVMRNPYPVYRQLQEEAPVFWSQQMDAWVITRHEDVDGALKNPGLFSSARIHK